MPLLLDAKVSRAINGFAIDDEQRMVLRTRTEGPRNAELVVTASRISHQAKSSNDSENSNHDTSPPYVLHSSHLRIDVSFKRCDCPACDHQLEWDEEMCTFLHMMSIISVCVAFDHFIALYLSCAFFDLKEIL